MGPGVPKDLSIESSDVRYFDGHYQLFPLVGAALDDVKAEAQLLATVSGQRVHFLYNDQTHEIGPSSLDEALVVVKATHDRLGALLEQNHRDYMSRKFKLDEQVRHMQSVKDLLTRMVRDRREQLRRELREKQSKLQAEIKLVEKQLSAAVRDVSRETVVTLATSLVKLKEERDAVEDQLSCIDRGIRQEVLPSSYGVGREFG
jgi:hypothetical protein